MIPETTNMLLATIATPKTPVRAGPHTIDFPKTPVRASASTMDCPETPVRAAASTRAFPTAPFAETSSSDDATTADTVTPTTSKSTNQARVHVTYSSSADDLMPLVIATSNVRFNYNAMAALDPRNRTASALERQIQNLRSEADALVAAAEAKKKSGMTDSESDEPSSAKRQMGRSENTSTMVHKTPVKPSPRRKMVAFARDSMAGGRGKTPSRKSRGRKRPNDDDEYQPPKKRKVTKKTPPASNLNEEDWKNSAVDDAAQV